MTADLSEAFGRIDSLLLGVAFLAVLLILLVGYRSFVLPAAVPTTSLLALSASILVIWNLANWSVLLLNGQTQGILFIGAFGAFSLKADGVAQTVFVLTASEARDGQKKLSEHFPAGSGSATN